MKPTLLLSVAILLLLSLLLLSCTSQDEEPPAPNESTIPEVSEELPASNEIEPISQPTGPCTSQWRCISSTMKAYQLANCTFTQRITCPLGCMNDSCRASSTCTPGFTCINERRRAYRTEVCTFIRETECSWRCEDGDCIERAENATEENTTVATEEPAPAPPPPLPKLRLGESTTVSVGGEEHTLRLYNLQEDQAIMEMDGWRSSWLEEGQNHTFAGGVQITVVSIYFQQYSGGKQEVEYRVG